ncbi:MAG: hypothetical protein Tsb0013_12890 [Phycisphaerales bacterium]
MGDLETIQWLGALSGLFFTFCFGAIVGSFLNVVVYRLPRGQNLVKPPSACPACGTRLPWKYNFPIFGWLRLRGRCAFCKSRISPEYPIVEACTALLFSVTFALWYMRPSLFGLIGVDAWAWTPEWALAGFTVTWPYFILLLVLFASLIAITLIDAKTFLIPLELPWLVGALGLVVHPAHALWLSMSGQLHRVQTESHAWTIPLASGPWLGASLLGALGIVIASVMLWKGWMPRSFADYEAWEQRAREDAERARAEATPETSTAPTTPSASSSAMRALLFAGPGVAGMFFGMTLGLRAGGDAWMLSGAIGLVVGLLIGLVLRRVVPASSEVAATPEPPRHGEDDFLWTMYPHARREMLKEILFLLPCAALGALGWWLCDTGPLATPAAEAPLWLGALGGSVLGLLVGGGVVWAVRILGSLAFNKEAMGLGDVHLMAGVGAVLGWIDPTLAFFLAPFTGILWVLLSVLSKALFNRAGAHLPYGPQLALMTVAVVVLKPVVEAGLTMLMGETVNLP